jgi:hypothetical protein
MQKKHWIQSAFVLKVAAAAAVLPGCGDDDKQEPAQPGVDAGVVARPPDAGGMMILDAGVIIRPPIDAGIAIRPPDAGTQADGGG